METTEVRWKGKRRSIGDKIQRYQKNFLVVEVGWKDQLHQKQEKNLTKVIIVERKQAIVIRFEEKTCIDKELVLIKNWC